MSAHNDVHVRNVENIVIVWNVRNVWNMVGTSGTMFGNNIVLNPWCTRLNLEISRRLKCHELQQNHVSEHATKTNARMGDTEVVLLDGSKPASYES